VYVRVRGKGDRERDVPVMPQLGRRLRRHVERGRPRGTTSDRVFLGLRRGRSGDHEPLTRSGVDQLIRLLGEEAGLEKRVHPHLLRHSFATWALTRGMNPVQLAQIMGHSSLAMIQSVYAHLTPQDAYLALEQIVRADE
jgi:integrase